MKIFDAIKAHNPDRIALCDETWSVSYGDLKHEIGIRMDFLLGVSTLAIALDNGVDWVLWDLAALNSGIPCVPVPPFFTAAQVSHLLSSAGVSHILSPDGLRNTGTRKDEILPNNVAKVTFTSGTTGAPKGVCLPQSAMENVASGIVDVLGDEFVGVHASILPLAVLLENVAGVYAGLMAGCAIHLSGLKSFGQNYARVHEVLKDTKANSAILVPEILRILMMQVVMKGPLPDLKFIAVGGSKVYPALVLQARKMGLPVYEGYGLSECASVVSLNTPKNDRAGSVGMLLPHVKARIVGEEIQIMEPGFLGYVGERAPDVFNTGDLGHIDENGFLSVTGRKKNVLITSYGRNVSPEWVESVLLAQSAIAQAIVYGDAQSALSALIVPASSSADIPDALSKANTALPDYACVHDFQIVSPFTVAAGTLTGTGRPRRENILNIYKKEKDYEFLQSAG
jgi:long-chain acyl-CoA synthetase